MGFVAAISYLQSAQISVPEVPRSGEHHRGVAFVAGGDHFDIVLGASGLQEGGDPGVERGFYAVGEREEGLAREHGAFGSAAGFVHGQAHGIDAAHLACSEAQHTCARRQHERVRHHVLAHLCPLGNDPIPTFGEIADTHHVVDSSHYWMISAPTYIGNSGGGIFDAETHELMGIFSKIYTHGSLRPTVVPHMGLVTSLTTIYDWLDTVGYASLVPAEGAVRAQTASAKR
jgi:hypothetical protein